MSALPKFSVVIVNYESGNRLSACLESLKAQTLAPHEIIVVDNGSADGSLARAKTADGPFILLEPGENLGFAAGNNRAADKATGDWLALLNPDAYAAPDWLAKIADGIARHPDVDAFGSLQVDADNPERLDGAGDAYFFAGAPYRGHFGWPASRTPSEGECFAPCGAAAVYRLSRFRALGGFCERFFCYGEDVDLGFRLRLEGGRAVQLPSAVVRHEGSGITGRRSDFTMYHGHRNRIWTYFTDMPTSLLIATLPLHLLLNLYLLGRFTVSGEARPYLRALRDGFGGLPEIWRERRAVQARRSASVLAIAGALTWSPVKLFRRQADVKALS